jgi:hypothetical protein
MTEVIVKIEGEDCFLIPSFKNFRRLETRTGERILKIAQRFLSQDYGADDIAAVLYCLSDLKDEKKGKYDDFAEKIYKAGFMQYAGPVIECLTAALTYGQEDTEGKPEAGAEK